MGKRIRKAAVILLTISMLLPLNGLQAAEGAENAADELYTELYRMDFDGLAEKPHFATGETPNTEAFDAEYGEYAKLLSTTDTYSYAIGAKKDDSSDKFIELKQTDVSVDYEGDTKYNGMSAIQIELPDGGFKANSGVYKISYDVKWLSNIGGHKPFMRVKTCHIDPMTDPEIVKTGGVCIWGPCLNAIGPVNDSGSADQSAENVYGTYSTWKYYADDGEYIGAEYRVNFTGSFDQENMIKLESNKWYNAEIIIDTDNKKADYYYDNVYVGTQEGDTFGEGLICGDETAKYIQLQAEQGAGVANGYQFDNIVISKATDKVREDVELSVFELVDDNGGDIEKGDTMTANMTIRNNTGKEQTAFLVVAVYNDGILRQADSQEIKTSGSALCGQVSVTVDNPDEAEVKAYLWRGAESGSPFVEPIVYKKAAETEPDLVDISLGFEYDTLNYGFDGLYGISSLTEADNESTGMLLLDPEERDGVTTGEVMLGKAVDSGVLKVSFDYKVTTFVNNFYVRLVTSTGDAANTFYDRNTFTYCPDTTGWALADKRAAYKENEWNTVNMYVNLDTRLVYFYKNDILYGFTTLNESIADIASLQFTCHGSYGSTYMDNLCVKEYCGEDEALPQEVKWTTTAQINTSAVGRIFYDKALQSFTVTTANKTESPVEYVLKYSVLKQDGSLLYEEEKTLAMEPGEVKDTELQTHTDGFGYYYIDVKLCDKQGGVLADADDVRFSVSNIPTEGVKNKKAGIQMNSIVNMNVNDMVQDLKLVEPLGFYYSRTTVGSWEILVPEQEKFIVPTWQQYIVGQFTEHGLYQTPTIAYANPVITSENPPRSPEALAQLAWFAQQLAMYYHNNNFNEPRQYIDVWNEYWMDGSVFNPDSNTPEDYANMLKAVYPAVKDEKVSQNSRIFGFSGLDISNLEWAERVLAAGAADYMDGYSIHPYDNKIYPEAVDLPGFVKKIDDMFEKYGRYDLPVWISEWGWPSSGHSGYPNEMQQASYFVRAFVINESYDCAEMLNWYASNDLQNDLGQESRFGLFRNQYAEIPYEAKPVYLTAANYNALMTDAEPVAIHKLGDNVTGYRYKLSDGRDCIVAWAIQTDEKVTFTLDTDCVTIYDAYGNQSSLSGENNSFSIAFDIMPQYIVGDFSEIN